MMSPRRALTRLLATGSLTLLATGGCDTTQQHAREAAQRRWNLARAEVKAQLAADQFSAGNIDGAAGELAQAYQLDPNNPHLIPLRVRVLLAEGQTQQAEALLQSARVEYEPNAEIEYLLGVVWQQQQKLDDALAAYLRAVELNDAELAYAVAAAQAWLQLGQPHQALTFLNERSSAFAWTNAYQAVLAECHEQLGNWSAAASAWQRVVYGDGGDLEIQMRLGEALFQARRYLEAIPVFEQVLADHPPPGPPAHLRLTLAECYLAGGRTDAAHEQTRLVVHDDGENAAALRLLARCLAAESRYASALRIARRALAIDPQDPRSLELAGALAWRADELDLAREFATQLQTIEPRNDVAASVLSRVRAGE